MYIFLITLLHCACQSNGSDILCAYLILILISISCFPGPQRDPLHLTRIRGPALHLPRRAAPASRDDLQPRAPSALGARAAGQTHLARAARDQQYRGGAAGAAQGEGGGVDRDGYPHCVCDEEGVDDGEDGVA